jgi:hypothetical protein
MFEKYMVTSRGFQNVVENGKIIGFQMKIRLTYYRGICLAIIAGLEVSVDGEKFAPEQLRFSVGGHSYTLEELGREEKVRWEFGRFATLTVLKPGGLQPGLHEIYFEEVIKPAYIPARGFVAHTKRKMTLVA